MATIQEICQEVIPISEISKVCNSAASTTSVETNSRDSLSPHIHHQVKETMKSSSEGDEMGEVREENGRLKLVLSKMLKDYKSLQQHIHEITAADTKNIKIYDDNDDDVDVVLSLGRPSSSVLSAAKISDQQTVYNKRGGGELDDNSEVNDQTFALHLDCKHDSAAAGSDNQHQIKAGDSKSNNDQSRGKSEEEEETVSKDLRRSRTGEDDQYLKNPPKKARVSVRAICNAPTMNDGCQWRKYGQKIAKGNPCPRAYYRCTISASCPVRKHVQRCPEDMSILVTTYEGSHDHPLPPSATAMASTTSAAVSMLKASSTTSTSQQSLSLPSTTSIHTLNSQHPPFYLPNTTISTSHTHPTVTLDLTAPTASSRYNKYASTFLPSQPPPYNSSTNCLNFSAPSSSSSSFEYWNSRPNHSVTSSLSSYNGTQIYQPYYNMPRESTYDQVHQPQYSIDNIAAATKEITSNPNFQSVLAAAISSIVGKSGAQRMEPSLDFGYTSYLNRTSTVVPSNSQTTAGNIKFVLPFGSNEGPFVAGSSAEKGEYKM